MAEAVRATPASYLPRHVAVVMDGNGRWAEQRGLPRRAGHQAGYEAVQAVVRSAADRGIGHLTLFAFSSENWRRPGEEIAALMTLLMHALRREIAELHDRGVRLDFLGQRSRLSARLRSAMQEAEELTLGNDRFGLHVAVSYGGRWDIVSAARRLAEDAVAGRLLPADIDEQKLRDATSLAAIPDPDLFIRTGGEYRISNFLLWNLAYSELYFTDTLWPDFDDAALEAALAAYARRQRRYGRVPASARGRERA